MNPGRRIDNPSPGTMLRVLGAAQKRDVKATQNLSRIVAFFIVCWFPLYTINCIQAFCPNCEVNQILLNSSIILSHLNSAGNPLLYAYHLKDFRAALKSFIYRLLFSSPKPTKKISPNVISNNRDSLRGSEIVNRRNQEIQNFKTPRTSLLRRATNNAAVGFQGVAIIVSNSQSRNESPEVPYELSSDSLASTPNDKKEYDDFLSHDVSPNSSEIRQIEDTSSFNNRSEYENTRPNTPDKICLSAMELATYPSYVRFVEPRLSEFCQRSESIFVVEADVNQTSSVANGTTRNLQLTIGEEVRNKQIVDG